MFGRWNYIDYIDIYRKYIDYIDIYRKYIDYIDIYRNYIDYIDTYSHYIPITYHTCKYYRGYSGVGDPDTHHPCPPVVLPQLAAYRLQGSSPLQDREV
ncbi:uncharacterized protein [Haliotis cracherodii]|uniref:uncharacterized protein isoform X2 n=1 Tax=Haliotis cracherodii TaxID=6455 RepID=UPI0039EC23A4